MRWFYIHSCLIGGGEHFNIYSWRQHKIIFNFRVKSEQKVDNFRGEENILFCILVFFNVINIRRTVQIIYDNNMTVKVFLVSVRHVGMCVWIVNMCTITTGQNNIFQTATQLDTLSLKIKQKGQSAEYTYTYNPFAKTCNTYLGWIYWKTSRSDPDSLGRIQVHIN